MQQRRIHILLAPLMALWILSDLALAFGQNKTDFAEATPEPRTYYTPEERRNAGREYQIFKDLSLFPLLETEYNFYSHGFAHSAERFHSDESSITQQLALVYAPLEFFKTEAIYEIETGDQFKEDFDEVVLSFDYGKYGLEAGRINLPFGEFLSHFATSPLLEFTVTRADGFVFSYEQEDQFELELYTFKSIAKKSSDLELTDAGLTIKTKAIKNLEFGLSYITNASNYQEEISLEEDFQIPKKLPAFGTYMTFAKWNYFFTFEYMQLSKTFLDDSGCRRKPWSLNIEFSKSLSNAFELALRVEKAVDLFSEPARRVGLAATYRFNDAIVWTNELLYGNFSSYAIEFPRAGDVRDQITFGSQLIYGF